LAMAKRRQSVMTRHIVIDGGEAEGGRLRGREKRERAQDRKGNRWQGGLGSSSNGRASVKAHEN